MSKRSLLTFAGALLIFLAGIGVGMQLGDEQATTVAGTEASTEENARDHHPRRRERRNGPSFDQWITSGTGAPSANNEAIEPQHQLDSGIRGQPASGSSVPADAPSVPESLQEAESVVQAALARGTLTPDDRAALTDLLPDISISDRNRLAHAIIAALSSGRLTLGSAQL